MNAKDQAGDTGKEGLESSPEAEATGPPETQGRLGQDLSSRQCSSCVEFSSSAPCPVFKNNPVFANLVTVNGSPSASCGEVIRSPASAIDLDDLSIDHPKCSPPPPGFLPVACLVANPAVPQRHRQMGPGSGPITVPSRSLVPSLVAVEI